LLQLTFVAKKIVVILPLLLTKICCCWEKIFLLLLRNALLINFSLTNLNKSQQISTKP
jgi:hypothetical protein